MENKEFTRWIKQIYSATNDTLDCDELQSALPHYVDALVDQQTIDPKARHLIEDHLNNCPDCQEVFEGLKFVVEQVDKSSTAASQTAVAAD